MTSLEIQVWDVPGVTKEAIVADALDASFRDARNEAGSASITVPLTSDYLALFGTRRVVKFVDDGAERFAWAVEQANATIVGDRLVLLVSGRGLMCWLEQMTVYPAKGLRRRSVKDRFFGFGAGNFYVTGPKTALGPVFADALTAVRSDVPPGWPVSTLTAMWPTSPDAYTAPGTQAWFYASWNEGTGKRFRIDATGDDGVEVWIDEMKIIDYGGNDKISPGQTGMATWKGILPVGGHWIMAKGRQIDVDSLEDLGLPSTGADKAWIAVRIASITSDSDTGVELTRTWPSTLEEPGWTPGFAMRLMRTEAIARGFTIYPGVTFENETDSNGAQFPHVVNRTWPVGTDLLKFATDLTDYGVDVWITPDRYMQMAVDRGVDRTAEIYLRPAGNLAAYALNRTLKVRTVGVVSTADGWLEQTDTAGIATYGRAETKIDLGTVDSLAQAEAFAAAALAPLAQPALETSGDTSLIPWEGATPYRDFGLADSVSVPDWNGGTRPATVQAIAWKKGAPDSWYLQLDLAQTGARRASPTTNERLLTIAKSGGAASAGGNIQSATK